MLKCYLFVINKNVGKEYEYISNSKIVSYDQLKNINKDVQVIIASRDYYKDIKKEVVKYIDEELIMETNEIYKMIPQCYELIEPFKYKKYLKDNIDRINNLLNSLEDDKSIKTLNNVIKMRLSWNEKYTDEIFEDNMYFIEEIKMTSKEVFIDGGAYNGDTIDKFLCRVGSKFDKIYCFEPGKEQYEQLENKVSKYNFKNKISIYNKGLFSKNMGVGFSGIGTGFHMNINDNENEYRVISIDECNLNPTLIKLDVEGSELETLKGSIETLKKYKPNLAVCVYHKAVDILEIFECINNLGIKYKFYLRHHSKTINDTVLYAVKE